jgi:hypothetical protein
VYQCFSFEIPWDVPVHGLAFEPIIDNLQVLHHWTLSTVEEKLEPGVKEGRCTWETQSPVAGWAPGAKDTVLPADVGIHIADGKTSTFQFEIHYNNFTGKADALDRSGVRLCATSKLRKNEAVPVVLGGVCFGPLCTGLPPGKSEVTNTCVNLAD